MTDDKIYVGMASIPERKDGMARVVRTLIPQCDELCVCLNDYPESFSIPEFDRPDVRAIYCRNLGPAGKFYGFSGKDGYLFTIDDDIIYPDDYICRMKAAIDRYKKNAIIGLHGSIITRPTNHKRKLLHFKRGLLQDIPVHILGTGIFGYHSSTITIDWRKFSPGKIDEQVAVIAQEKNISMLCLAHPADWVESNAKMTDVNSLSRDEEELEKAKMRKKDIDWHLFLPGGFKEIDTVTADIMWRG